jgi:hypothetical protein
VIPDPVDVEAEAEEGAAEADPATAPEALGVVLFPVASPTMAPTPICQLQSRKVVRARTPLNILSVVVGSLLRFGGRSISTGDSESSGPCSSGVTTVGTTLSVWYVRRAGEYVQLQEIDL